MWQNNKVVVRTHTKNPSKMAWAIVDGVAGNKWLRIKPDSSDGVSNVFMILTLAQVNTRRVDVFVTANTITQATLR